MGSRGSKQGENARLEDVNITNNLDLLFASSKHGYKQADWI